MDDLLNASGMTPAPDCFKAYKFSISLSFQGLTLKGAASGKLHGMKHERLYRIFNRFAYGIEALLLRLNTAAKTKSG